MRRDIMPMAFIVMGARDRLGQLDGPVREMLLVAGGVNGAQRLIEQHRQQSEQPRQPVKASLVLSRGCPVSVSLKHLP